MKKSILTLLIGVGAFASFGVAGSAQAGDYCREYTQIFKDPQINKTLHAPIFNYQALVHFTLRARRGTGR